MLETDYSITGDQAQKQMRVHAIEEALANLSGKQGEIIKLKGLREFIAKIQAWLRSVGFGLDVVADWMEGKTDAEALQFIMQARAAVTKPGPYIVTGEQVAAFSQEGGAFTYSALTRMVEGMPDRIFNQSAAMVGMWIKGNASKFETKADEIFWSGLDNYLQAQGKNKVSKADVLAYLDEKNVKTVDVVLGGKTQQENMEDAISQEQFQRPYAELTEDERVDIDTEVGIELTQVESLFAPGLRHANLNLPGGTNHRETVTTIPSTEAWDAADTIHFGDVGKGQTVSWSRTNDRTDADGADGRFIEEIQSRRVQAGKRDGFQIKPENWDNPDYVEARRRAADAMNAFNRAASGAAKDSLRSEMIMSQRAERAFQGEGDVPPAPFITDAKNKASTAYIAMTMKKAVIQAINDGKTWVAWTTGEQQADRYRLSKQIDSVKAKPKTMSDGEIGYELIMTGKDGQAAGATRAQPESEVANHVGKELANKIFNDAKKAGKGGWKIYSGLDLDIGGEWTKAMYGDELGLDAKGLPSLMAQAANDILKHLGGGKVVAVDMRKPVISFEQFLVDREVPGAPDTDGALRAKYERAKKADTARVIGMQPGFYLTPSMIAKAKSEGLPAFSRGGGRDRTNIDTAMKRMGKFVDEFTLGKLNDEHTQILGPTPTVLQAIGAEALPIQINGATVRKVLAGKHDYHMTADMLKQVPEGLYDPLMVFNSPSKDGLPGKLILTEIEDKFGDPIVIAVHLDKIGEAFSINEITSAYGMQDAWARLGKLAGDGKLEYYRNKESLALVTPHLANWVGHNQEAPLGAQDSRKRILTEADVVKDYGPAFSRAKTQIDGLRDGKVIAQANQNPDGTWSIWKGDGATLRESKNYQKKIVANEKAVMGVMKALGLSVDGGFPSSSELREDIAKSANYGRPMGWLLNFFDRNQIVTLYNDSPIGKFLGDYKHLRDQSSADQNVLMEKYDDFLGKLRSLPVSLRDTFATIANEATLHNVDPTIKYLIEGSAARIASYDKLRKMWLGMPKEAQDIWLGLRTQYTDNADLMFKALEDRINRMDIDENSKRSVIAKLALEYDKMISGTYFPLYRRGDYIVTATRGEEFIREFHNSEWAAAGAERGFIKDGYRVKRNKRPVSAEKSKLGEALASIVGKLSAASDTGSIEGKALTDLMDQINQTIIQSQPDQSFRKQFQHRKGTAGYSNDFIRAYSDSMMRSASHISNLRYSDQITTAISNARQTIKDTDGNVEALTDVVNQIEKLEKKLAEPTAEWAVLAGQIGFTQMLGSLSNFVLNITQTPVFTFPWLGARYGFAKASFELTRATMMQAASMKLAKSVDDVGRSIDMRNSLKGVILEIFNRLHDSKRLDLSQAFDLIAAANNDTTDLVSGRMTLMKVIAMPMHVSEVINRQVTALAAIRLEMSLSGDAEKAYEMAKAAIDETHFDYSKENRASIMHGNVSRVIFMFKQYAQKAMFLWGHTANLALAGKTPGERKIARKQLAGMFAMQGLAAGVLGLPIFAEAAVVAGGVIGFKAGGKVGAVFGLTGSIMLLALAQGFGDDDGELFDTEVRNFMADNFGPEWEEIISRGALPGGLSSRMDASEMAIRRPDAGQSGYDVASAWTQAVLGAFFGGTVANAIIGWRQISDGDIARGFEKLMPLKQARDMMQAARFADEGVTNMRGQKIIPDITAGEIASKAFGIQPSSIVSAQERDRAEVVYNRTWTKKRLSLLDKWFDSEPGEDRVGRFDDISRYNLTAPRGYKITDNDRFKYRMRRRKEMRKPIGGVSRPKTGAVEESVRF